MTSPLTLRSSTGAALDPEDGKPIFRDGLSRKRWLDSTRPERKADLVEALRQAALPPEPVPVADEETE